MSLIEHWTLETEDFDERLAIVVRGEMPAFGQQIRLVEKAKYEALAEQLRGAVSVLREVQRHLDRSTQTGKAPTSDEWQALVIVNDALDRLGGQ